MQPSQPVMELTHFNAASVADARALLKACVDVPRWIDALLEARPFSSVEQLQGRAMTLAEQWTDAEVTAALAHHPRIGSQLDGEKTQGEFSQQEQAGVQASDSQAWVAANQRYEQKFNQIFLIRAAGRSSEEMLANLEKRLHNDAPAENAMRRVQLQQITVLRLQKSVTPDSASSRQDSPAQQPERSFVTTHVLDTTHGHPASGIAVDLVNSDGLSVGRGVTDHDGRIATLGPGVLQPGTYRICFDIGDYWAGHHLTAFYPKVELHFVVEAGQSHYHVPLLMSPWSISSYRGS